VKFPGPTRHMLSKDDPLDKTATFLPLNPQLRTAPTEHFAGGNQQCARHASILEHAWP